MAVRGKGEKAESRRGTGHLEIIQSTKIEMNPVSEILGQQLAGWQRRRKTRLRFLSSAMTAVTGQGEQLRDEHHDRPC